jgi:hypothetical protein
MKAENKMVAIQKIILVLFMAIILRGDLTLQHNCKLNIGFILFKIASSYEFSTPGINKILNYDGQ